jgi:hypothetical protein
MDSIPQSKTGALLESLEAGDLMRDADEALAELTKAVEITGGKGSITLKIDLERKKPGTVVVRAKVDAKVPKEEPTACIRYVGPAGDLLERDPAQAEFNFQNVAPMPGTAKQA